MKYSFLAVLCCNAFLAIGQDYYQQPSYPHEIGIGVTPIVAITMPAELHVLPAQITYKYVRPKWSIIGSLSYEYSELDKTNGRDLELVGTTGNRADFRLWEEEYHHTKLTTGVLRNSDTLKKMVFYYSYRVAIGWREYRDKYYNISFTNQTPGWFYQNPVLATNPRLPANGFARTNYYTAGPQIGVGFSWYPFKRISFDYLAFMHFYYMGFINQDVLWDPAGVLIKSQRDKFNYDVSLLQITVNYRIAKGN